MLETGLVESAISTGGQNSLSRLAILTSVFCFLFSLNSRAKREYRLPVHNIPIDMLWYWANKDF
jgi:hypothetical protein